MPKGERAEKIYIYKKKKKERCRGVGLRERERERSEEREAAARLIAVDLHDKRSRQLVTKVALRH